MWAVSIVDKLRENGLKWCGHVKRDESIRVKSSYENGGWRKNEKEEDQGKYGSMEWKIILLRINVYKEIWKIVAFEGWGQGWPFSNSLSEE